MDAHRPRCRTSGCLKDATHDVYWDEGPRHHWAIAHTDRAYVTRRRLRPQWCRWHATVEALLRNMDVPEATCTQGTPTTQHDNADTGARAQQGFPRAVRRFFHEDA